MIPLLAGKKSEVLNAPDKYGLTPVHLAALHGEVLCLKELISLGNLNLDISILQCMICSL